MPVIHVNLRFRESAQTFPHSVENEKKTFSSDKFCTDTNHNSQGLAFMVNKHSKKCFKWKSSATKEVLNQKTQYQTFQKALINTAILSE